MASRLLNSKGNSLKGLLKLKNPLVHPRGPHLPLSAHEPSGSQTHREHPSPTATPPLSPSKQGPWKQGMDTAGTPGQFLYLYIKEFVFFCCDFFFSPVHLCCHQLYLLLSNCWLLRNIISAQPIIN